MFHLRSPRCVAADLECPVTHTSQYSGGCSLVMVRVKGDVSISVSRFLVDCCSQSIWAPSDVYIEKRQFAILLLFLGELYVGILLIDVLVEVL